MTIIGRTLEDQKILFASEFGKQLLEFSRNITHPIYWQSNESGRWNIDGSGTVFFIKIDEQAFAVTAAHVIDGYLLRRGVYPKTSLHIGEIEIDIDSRIISNGSSCGVDIATLTVTPSEIAEMNRIALQLTKRNFPLQRCDRGGRLLVCGYPAMSRRNEYGELSFGALMTSPIVEAVNDRQITFLIERENIIPIFGGGYPEEGSMLGGISGAPMLGVVENEEGIVQFNLVGVVSDASNSIGEIIKGWHASFLNECGTVEKGCYT
jgi:hypothetical protein